VAPELQTYLSIKDPVEGFRRFRWVMIGIGASLIPVAVYFAILAARGLFDRVNSLIPA
jgi:hypothetical protein